MDWMIVNNKTGKVIGRYDSSDEAHDAIDVDDLDFFDLDVVPKGSVFMALDTKSVWAWPNTVHHPDW